MSSDTDLITRVAELIDEKLRKVAPCDGKAHNTGLLGHTATDPAALQLTSPCCGRTFNVCMGRYLWWLVRKDIECGICRQAHQITDYHIGPAGGTQ